jgi:AcrR family transcriptional regulator
MRVDAKKIPEKEGFSLFLGIFPAKPLISNRCFIQSFEFVEKGQTALSKEESKTKNKILDAAEELMADQGYKGTSIREITKAAKVHLSAVNYHFTNKEKLFVEVCARKIKGINDERLKLLDACEKKAGKEGPTVEEILTAFLTPPLSFGGDHKKHFMRLMGRLYVEPGDFWQPVYALFEEVVLRFATALGKACPHLEKEDLIWRFHFMIGSMCHTMMDTQGIGFLSDNKMDGRKSKETIKQLVSFVSAGFKA